MNFSDLQTETMADAFKEAQRPSVKRWLNYAAGQLWNHEEWTFRYAHDDVTVTKDSATVTGIATDLGIVIGVWNSDGERLRWINPADYNDLYYTETDTGTPSDFTVINKALTLGPIPDTSATYRLFYERAYGHYQADGTTFTTGEMDEPQDIPVFPAETHLTLVFWAREIGKALRSDPTAALESQLKDAGIEFMRRNFLADQRGEFEQWGAWDAEQDYWGYVL